MAPKKPARATKQSGRRVAPERKPRTSAQKPAAPNISKANVSEHIHDNPGFLMASTVFRLDQELRNTILRKLDISYTHFRLMQVIYAGEPKTVGEISKMIVVSPAVLSRVIDQMEGRGLVERRTDHADNRFVNVGLTQNGRTIYEKAWQPAQSLLARATSALSAQEKRSLLKILRKINQPSDW